MSIMRRPNGTTILLSLVALGAGCGRDEGVLDSAATLQTTLTPAEDANIVTFEHFVPHISTVPANAGASVQLSVRERFRPDTVDNRAPRVVLFIHGNTFPGVPGADLRLKPYDWMLALAKAGFDAFVMDHSGYGFSRSEEHTSELQSPCNLVCRLLLEKKKSAALRTWVAVSRDLNLVSA